MKVLDSESSVYMLLFGFISDMNYFMSDLILFHSVAINSNNLHKNVQCNSNQSNENLPLTCKTSENNEWFLCLCFALKFDCQSFLPNRFVILLSTGQEDCIMQRNVRYVGELIMNCVLSSCKLCSLNVFGNLSENTWKLLNMYTVCCSKYWQSGRILTSGNKSVCLFLGDSALVLWDPICPLF